MNPGGDDDYVYCAGQAWIDCDDAMGLFGPNPCGCDIAETGMSAGQVGEYNVEGIDECCGDDANEYLAPYCDPGNSANGNRVCCPSSDYCSDWDETCTSNCKPRASGSHHLTDDACTYDGSTQSNCCGGLHCDYLHPDGGLTYCCDMDEIYSDVLNRCVGSYQCTPECSTSWDPGCATTASGCSANQFCCDVPYQTNGDCFSSNDPLMGAWPY